MTNKDRKKIEVDQETRKRLPSVNWGISSEDALIYLMIIVYIMYLYYVIFVLDIIDALSQEWGKL